MTARVSLRIMVSRADLREIDRRADAAKVTREEVAAVLIAQSLEVPTAELPGRAPQVPTASDFGRAVFADAMRAQPGLAPVLLRLLGGKS
ncbi:hypothetical protein [Paraburkholderia ferrariae]|uniref:Ribbon-helix-helix protein CopG domain-containing protein n=1 Tax=Paraburkholderia ferrariae TaxID=386056 RepID=A0ABU9RIF7_9BURK